MQNNMKAKVITIVLSCLMTGTQAQNTDSIATGLTNFNDTTFALGGVTVKGNLPKTRVKGDAMRTIVAGTVLEKAGTVSDVLKRIPMLKTEKEGAVEVFGRGDAEVYINGRKVVDLNELSRLRSEQVKSVDVVQNPGARYAASTKAVVRIQLVKAKGEGLSFTENASASYQYGTTLTNNFDLNYRKGGLDITGSFWNGRYDGLEVHQDNDLTYFVGSDKYVDLGRQFMEYDYKGWSPQIQINYMFDDNHSIGAFYKYDRKPKETYEGWLNTDIYANGEKTERSESDIYKEDTFKKHIFNAYYNGRIGKLSIDFNVDGLFNSSDDDNSTTETTILPDGSRTQSLVNNLTINENNFWATKLIFSYPVWNGNLSVGGEYSHNNRTDIYSYNSQLNLPVKATDTKIKESSTAGFVEYGRLFGRLFAQVGLRYERISNDYYNFGKLDSEVSQTYTDLFPSAVVSMPIGKWQTSLSYRRDIQRPYYSQLSSSTIYINRYSLQSGNPYLKPTYTHSIVFNTAYKAFNLSINYAHTKDVVTMLTEPFPGSNDPLLSLIHPVNSHDGYDKLIIMPSFRPTIGVWHPMWTAGLILQNYKTLTAKGSEMTMNNPFYQVIWNNDIVLSNGWRLNGGMQFNSKGDYDNFRISCYMFRTDLGIQKDFNLKALGTITADIRCYDIFNTAKTGTTIYGIRELTVENESRRTFSIDLTWKFNEARSKYKGSGAGAKQKARM